MEDELRVFHLDALPSVDNHSKPPAHQRVCCPVCFAKMRRDSLVAHFVSHRAYELRVPAAPVSRKRAAEEAAAGSGSINQMFGLLAKRSAQQSAPPEEQTGAPTAPAPPPPLDLLPAAQQPPAAQPQTGVQPPPAAGEESLAAQLVAANMTIQRLVADVSALPGRIVAALKNLEAEEREAVRVAKVKGASIEELGILNSLVKEDDELICRPCVMYGNQALRAGRFSLENKTVGSLRKALADHFGLRSHRDCVLRSEHEAREEKARWREVLNLGRAF